MPAVHHILANNRIANITNFMVWFAPPAQFVFIPLMTADWAET